MIEFFFFYNLLAFHFAETWLDVLIWIRIVRIKIDTLSCSPWPPTCEKKCIPTNPCVINAWPPSQGPKLTFVIQVPRGDWSIFSLARWKILVTSKCLLSFCLAEKHLKTLNQALIILMDKRKDCHVQKDIMWLCSLGIFVEKDFSLNR